MTINYLMQNIAIKNLKIMPTFRRNLTLYDYFETVRWFKLSQNRDFHDYGNNTKPSGSEV